MAYATDLVLKKNPWLARYKKSKMMKHAKKMIKKGKIKPFPKK